MLGEETLRGSKLSSLLLSSCALENPGAGHFAGWRREALLPIESREEQPSRLAHPPQTELVDLPSVGVSSTNGVGTFSLSTANSARGVGLFKLIRLELHKRSSVFLLIKHELLSWSSVFLLIKNELLSWSSVASHQNKPTPRTELAIFASEVSTPRVEEAVFHPRGPNSTRGVRFFSRYKP